jgi:two-component system chemotaxis sensor kinase CheA
MNEKIYDDNDTVFELYLFETNTLLDRFDDMLRMAKSDGSISSRIDAEIERIMKTIKNSSDMMRLGAIADAAFETENLFNVVSGLSLSEAKVGKLADAGMWVSDFIRKELERIPDGESATPEETDELITAIKKFTEFIKTGEDETAETPAPAEALTPKPTAITPEISEIPDDEPEPEIPAKTLVYRMHVYFYENSRMENVRAYLLADKLSKIGKIEAVYPENVEENPETSDEINENGYYIALETHLTREQLERIMKGTLSVESVSFVGSMPNYELKTEAETPAKAIEPPVKNTDNVNIILTTAKSDGRAASLENITNAEISEQPNEGENR